MLRDVGGWRSGAEKSTLNLPVTVRQSAFPCDQPSAPSAPHRRQQALLAQLLQSLETDGHGMSAPKRSRRHVGIECIAAAGDDDGRKMSDRAERLALLGDGRPVVGRLWICGRHSRGADDHPFGAVRPTNQIEGSSDGSPCVDMIRRPSSSRFWRTTCTAKSCTSQSVISIRASLINATGSMSCPVRASISPQPVGAEPSCPNACSSA